MKYKLELSYPIWLGYTPRFLTRLSNNINDYSYDFTIFDSNFERGNKFTLLTLKSVIDICYNKLSFTKPQNKFRILVVED